MVFKFLIHDWQKMVPICKGGLKELITLSYSLGITLFLFFSINTLAASVVKSTQSGARGCLNRLSSEEAQREISDFNLTTKNANSLEKQTLGTALAWIKMLNGNKPLSLAQGQPGKPYPFTFTDRWGESQQFANRIEIRRNGSKNYGTNIAQLVHELGHYVGNNGAYQSYNKAMGNRRCQVSNYSMNRKRNEQFAEVFAAFVASPDLIKNNPSTGCQLAWDFFTNKLFEDGSKANSCLPAKLNMFKQKEPGWSPDEGEDPYNNYTQNNNRLPRQARYHKPSSKNRIMKINYRNRIRYRKVNRYWLSNSHRYSKKLKYRRKYGLRNHHFNNHRNIFRSSYHHGYRPIRAAQ